MVLNSTQTQKPNDLVALILVRLHSRGISRNSWSGKLSKAFYERCLSAILISRRVESVQFKQGTRRVPFAFFNKKLPSESQSGELRGNSWAVLLIGRAKVCADLFGPMARGSAEELVAGIGIRFRRFPLAGMRCMSASCVTLSWHPACFLTDCELYYRDPLAPSFNRLASFRSAGEASRIRRIFQ